MQSKFLFKGEKGWQEPPSLTQQPPSPLKKIFKVGVNYKSISNRNQKFVDVYHQISISKPCVKNTVNSKIEKQLFRKHTKNFIKKTSPVRYNKNIHTL